MASPSPLISFISFIGDKFCERIAHKLRSDVVKTDVQLRGNYIACQGGVSLADMLRSNSAIRSLSLEWNDIGACGWGDSEGIEEGTHSATARLVSMGGTNCSTILLIDTFICGAVCRHL